MKALLLILILLLTSCSTLEKLQDKSAESITKAIKIYCSGTAEIDRMALRDDINQRLDGTAHIAINCLGN